MTRKHFARLFGLLVTLALLLTLAFALTFSSRPPAAPPPLPTLMVLPTQIAAAPAQPQQPVESVAAAPLQSDVMVESQDASAAQPAAVASATAELLSPQSSALSPGATNRVIVAPVVGLPALGTPADDEAQLLTEPPADPVPGQLVLSFAPDADAAARDAVIAGLGGRVVAEIPALNRVVVELPAGAPTVESASGMITVEPDYYAVSQADIVLNDPLAAEQWGLPVVGAPDGWAALPVDVPAVTVAIIDSGICAAHPELAGRVLPGYDFVDDDSDPQDAYGHGCGVAGVIAAAAGNSAGIAGIAPNTRILPVRALDANGIGTYSDVAAAIVYAADNGAQIINLSLGGVQPSGLLTSAVDYAMRRGAVVVAAAGNTGRLGVLYPAAYAPVIAVASIDPNMQPSRFSSYGPEVDVFAPGRGILTTAADGSYTTLNGTSLAAPHAAGVLALEMAVGRSLTLGGIARFGGGLAAPVTPAPTDDSAMPPVSRDDLAIHNYRRLIVKFAEGTAVRLRAGALTSQAGADLSAFSAIVATVPGTTVERLFTRPEADLDAERLTASALAGEPLPDLNLYYALTLPDTATLDDAAQMLDDLNALGDVQTAYAEPVYALANVDIPPTTPNFFPQQTYFDPAPVGIDADYAWTIPGGRGNGVTVLDIEWGWDFDHEDLQLDADDLISGTNDTFDPHHGSSVMGQLIAADNGYGVTGLVPDATGKVASVWDEPYPNVANTISLATAATAPGDVLLYEMHAPSHALQAPPNQCNGSQYGYIAIEYWQANFDATRTAVALGRIVVQAAGNGSMDFDHPRYGGLFNRNVRDSGAIIVGAATPGRPDGGGRVPECWTNHGSRVDVYGWGSEIYTAGGGDLFGGSNNGSVTHQEYTAHFGGTSGASPIVVGAAAALQGMAKANGMLITPADMRALLRETGTPQAANPRQIGTMPNLRAAAAQLGSLLPGAPAPEFPADDIHVRLPNIELRWFGATGATRYQLQMTSASDLLFGSPLVNQSNLTDIVYDAGALGDGEYLWRVRAFNSANEAGAWSAIQRFTVDRTPPAVPALLTPADATSSVTARPQFTWQTIPDAARYEFRIGMSNPPEGSFIVSLTAPQYRPAAALLTTTHYWQVRAVDRAGNESAWSAPFSVLVPSPTNAAPRPNLFTTLTPTLRWSRVSWATNYEVQVDNNANFSSPEYQRSVDSNTLEIVLDRQPYDWLAPFALTEGRWYWRVRASNARLVNGAWSATQTFFIDLP